MTIPKQLKLNKDEKFWLEKGLKLLVQQTYHITCAKFNLKRYHKASMVQLPNDLVVLSIVFFKLVILGLLFYIFIFSLVNNKCYLKSKLMTDFETVSSGVDIDRSANWATTTAANTLHSMPTGLIQSHLPNQS